MQAARLVRTIMIVVALTRFVSVQALAEDCNQNGVDDHQDLISGSSLDCNANGRPDECDTAAGTMSFSAAREYGIENVRGTSHLVAGDFDGDGETDIVSRLYTATPENEFKDRELFLALSLATGDGHFSPPELTPLGEDAGHLNAADLDGDGDLDVLVVEGSGSGSGPWGWRVFHNDGSGGFSEAQTSDEARNASRFVIADLDGIRGPDLALVNHKDMTISLFSNRGDGTFDLAKTLSPSVLRISRALAADLDGDGDPDLVVNLPHKNEDGSWGENVGVFENLGGFEFADLVEYTAGECPTALRLGDLDGDGDLDLVACAFGDNSVVVLENQGDGTFGPPHAYTVGLKPDFSLLGDLDSDGDQDIVVLGGDTNGSLSHVSVLLNAGDGSFPDVSILPFQERRNIRSAALGDVDGDDDLDLVTADGTNGVSNTISLLRGRGDGSFDRYRAFRADSENHIIPRQVVLADSDHDGDLDAIIGNLRGGIAVMENVPADAEGLIECVEFVRGDMNSDGILSISDVIYIRRYMWSGFGQPTCLDALDLDDDDDVNICDEIGILERLFLTPDWTEPVAAPFPEPGLDPSPYRYAPGSRNCHDPFLEEDIIFPGLGCGSYTVTPPESSDDLVVVGDVSAQPGETVRIPVWLTNSRAVDGVQLVLHYDPEILSFESGISSVALDFDGTAIEVRDDFNPFRVLTAHSGSAVLTVAIANSLFEEGKQIPAGENQLLVWIEAKVADDAPAGTFTLDPVPSGGVGPFSLRNELSYQGVASFVSVLPKVLGGELNIVPDQSVFLRGDADGNDAVELTDAVATLGWLFLGADVSAIDRCRDAADSNDDGALDVSDPVATLETIFLGSQRIRPPYPKAGLDVTADQLGCNRPISAAADA